MPDLRAHLREMCAVAQEALINPYNVPWLHSGGVNSELTSGGARVSMTTGGKAKLRAWVEGGPGQGRWKYLGTTYSLPVVLSFVLGEDVWMLMYEYLPQQEWPDRDVVAVEAVTHWAERQRRLPRSRLTAAQQIDEALHARRTFQLS